MNPIFVTRFETLRKPGYGAAFGWLCAALLVAFANAALARADDDPLATERKAIDEHRFEDAKTALAAYVSEHADSSEAVFMLGKAESCLGNYQVAEEKIKAAIALDDSVGEYYAELGSVMIARAQTLDMFEAGPIYMGAVEQFRKSVAVDPDNLHGHIALCRYYWNAPEVGGGSIVRAKEEAAEVERLNPYLGKVEYALIAKKEGRTDDAVARFEELVAMDEKNVWAQVELGKLYRAQGKLPEAKAMIEKALALDPENADAEAALSALATTQASAP